MSRIKTPVAKAFIALGVTMFAGQAVAAECGIRTADRPDPAVFDCTLATIEACTLNDPEEAERLLLARLNEAADPATLYHLARYYADAPPLFRDPVLADWYLVRAAQAGNELALATFEATPPPSPPDTIEPVSAIAATTVLPERVPLNVPDPESTLTGVELSIADVMEVSYAAGFCTETQLLAIVAIAIAESSLWTAARNWKPENGLRDASDYIGVQGPPEVWIDDRQMHSDRGLWQISSYAWASVPDSIADDPLAAARAVYEISAGGTDFTPWDSFTRGNAQRHYDHSVYDYPPLRPLIRQFLAEQG